MGFDCNLDWLAELSEGSDAELGAELGAETAAESVDAGIDSEFEDFDQLAGRERGIVV